MGRISDEGSRWWIADISQVGLYAQGRGGRGGGAAPQNAKAAAVFDPTGYWVSVITEDWRYRMVTPSLGDYQGVPMTPEARKIADAWDPAKEEASGDVCKSYGAPALLRVPNRLHITWQDDQTLPGDVRLVQPGLWHRYGHCTSPDTALASSQIAATSCTSSNLAPRPVFESGTYSAGATTTPCGLCVKQLLRYLAGMMCVTLPSARTGERKP